MQEKYIDLIKKAKEEASVAKNNVYPSFY